MSSHHRDHAVAGAPPSHRTDRRRADRVPASDHSGRRAVGRHHYHGGARLRLRLQRVRRRRPRYPAGAGSRRPHFLRISGAANQNHELGRQLASSGALNHGQAHQSRSGTMSASNTCSTATGASWCGCRRPTALSTTETDLTIPRRRSRPSSPRAIGDIEVMGMYTGFFKDMSTGVIFGLKFPTGTLHRPRARSRHPDRLGQHRPAARRLPSRHAQRRQCLAVFLAGDVAAAVPLSGRRGPAGLLRWQWRPGAELPPGLQVDGAVGILYNNWYNVLGFDKITPLGQVIISHRAADTGTGADPFNSGFDRVMLSPGIEFTKVLDEANNRV